MIETVTHNYQFLQELLFSIKNENKISSILSRLFPNKQLSLRARRSNKSLKTQQ